MTDGHRLAPPSAVLEAAGDALGDGHAAVLATIVAVEGRAYRRPGAKMLLTPDGQDVGHVTAGCLEDRLASLARDVLDEGFPRVETYDLQADEDVWGLGVGCNGVIEVLLEPVGESVQPLLAAQEADEPVAAITVLDGDDVAFGTRWTYEQGAAGADTSQPAGAMPTWLDGALVEPVNSLFESDSSQTISVERDGHHAQVFVDVMTPSPRLVVVGAGHDVGPVVDLAAGLDFRTTVVGFRGSVDLDARFSQADRTVTTSPADLASAIDLDAETYAVVMTHNFVDDRIAVAELLQHPVPYVGLMGPGERFAEMREAIEAETDALETTDFERLYTPVGLDLGTESPVGVATSILAEVLAVHNDRTPLPLSERAGPIHERVEVDGQN